MYHLCILWVRTEDARYARFILKKKMSAWLSLWENLDQNLKICKWTASSEFGTYRLCEQRRLRRACASSQSRQNLTCSLIQAVSQEEPSDRKPDPWPLWMAGHVQLKFVMTECSKTQIRSTGLKWSWLPRRPPHFSILTIHSFCNDWNIQFKQSCMKMSCL